MEYVWSIFVVICRVLVDISTVVWSLFSIVLFTMTFASPRVREALVNLISTMVRVIRREPDGGIHHPD